MAANRKYLWLAGLSTALLTGLLLYVGVGVILGNQLSAQNVLVYTAFALLLGGISAASFYYRLWPLFALFHLGIAAGFFEMFRMFIDGVGGWGDLAGLLSLFVFIAFGLGIGLVVQLIVYLIKRFRK